MNFICASRRWLFCATMGAGKLNWEVHIANMYETRQAAIDYSDDEFMDVT